MLINFEKNSKTFHIKNKNVSYLIKILETGHLMHLYWGRKLNTNNLDYLIEKNLWGSFLANTDNIDTFQLEATAQEYPGYGSTDLRSPAIELQFEDGTSATDFRYDGHKIITGKPRIENLPATYVENDDEAETLEERETLTGYTNIRKFFLTDEFFNMKAREKRVIIYICQLLDSKASRNYKNISINLLKFNSSWLKILKTKCKYYAKNTIENMLEKYKDIFNDFSSLVREKDIAPKTVTSFKFTFTCESLNNRNSEEDMLELIKLKNPKEYALVKDKVEFAQITLSKQKIMHIVRAISTIKEWFLKERVTQLIINKYIAIQIHHSRENIKSLPAYSAAVVKAVVNEYNDFKEKFNKHSSDSHINNYYDTYIENDSFSSTVTEDIQYALSMLKAV